MSAILQLDRALSRPRDDGDRAPESQARNAVLDLLCGSLDEPLVAISFSGFQSKPEMVWCSKGAAAIFQQTTSADELESFLRHCVVTVPPCGTHWVSGRGAAYELVTLGGMNYSRSERVLLLNLKSTAAPKLPPHWKPIAAPLTPRQTEVLTLLAGGLCNKEIAARLFLSPNTIRTHLENIYAKLGVSNRVEALNRASELGCLPH